ncbi:hypothetical protein NIES25_19330 [Nostoc linckia NIES-25]|nr:hypothetical protein NIES25_19330 [Nostoc linckia NIES-25]
MKSLAKVLLNLNMKFKNQLFSTLTLCDSAPLRELNSYFQSATPLQKYFLYSCGKRLKGKGKIPNLSPFHLPLFPTSARSFTYHDRVLNPQLLFANTIRLTFQDNNPAFAQLIVRRFPNIPPPFAKVADVAGYNFAF